MAASTQPAPGTGWVISSQTPTTGLDGGRPVPGWNISFISGRGHQGQLFVPAAQYNVDNVRALVTAQATTLDNVGALTG